MPTGKDWAAAAKEWLALHGVSVPDARPQEQRISALLPKTERLSQQQHQTRAQLNGLKAAED